MGALLQGQRELPDAARQSCVLVRFAEPVRRSAAGEFLRIHLTREMLDGGEGEFYQAEIYQPHRAAVKLCPSCGRTLHRINPSVSVCRNPRCEHQDVQRADGPVRGVVQSLVFEDFVVGTEYVTERRLTGVTLADMLARRYSAGRLRAMPRETVRIPVELIDRCCLVLDRRYPDAVLEAVYRTAGHLADMMGWRIL